ncbi:hypothetical protein KKH56_03355 [bacterium]|nr:hypothetical protein [bacterium]
MSPFFIFYNLFFLLILCPGFHLLSLFNKKIRLGIKGRKALFCDLEKINFGQGKWILIHSSSWGEFLRAAPLISALKEKDKKLKILATFFSPSGFGPAKASPLIDASCYLPFDSPSNVHRFLKLVNPRFIIFVKYDLWPNLIFKAGSMEIPLFLIDANIKAGSKKLRPLFRYFYKQLYGRFGAICTISEEASLIFSKLVSEKTTVVSTGDTVYEQVYLKMKQPEGKETVRLKSLTKGFLLVAGSTWEEDEKVVLGAYQRLPGELNLILVPHEPGPERLSFIEAEVKRRGLQSLRLSNLKEKIGEGTILIVDKIGILADLYSLANMAFVGGAYGPGVHNVLEPAVMKMPVFFGPRISNSTEAGSLIKERIGFVVRDEEELASLITKFLKDKAFLEETGQRAINLILKNLGASKRIADILA